jgi:UDP-glucose 4-epimerase
MKKQILVTGGAGYIGSHTVKQLGEAGYDLVVYDNLSTGNASAISYGTLAQGDLADRQQLEKVFAAHDFDAVLHFAASISVPDSIVKPLEYYSNNTANTLNLLHCCQQFGVNKFSQALPLFTDNQLITQLLKTQSQYRSILTAVPS